MNNKDLPHLLPSSQVLSLQVQHLPHDRNSFTHGNGIISSTVISPLLSLSSSFIISANPNIPPDECGIHPLLRAYRISSPSKLLALAGSPSHSCLCPSRPFLSCHRGWNCHGRWGCHPGLCTFPPSSCHIPI